MDVDLASLRIKFLEVSSGLNLTSLVSSVTGLGMISFFLPFF